MKVPMLKPGDRVAMIPETGWRGEVVKKHPHRNNGYKVRTITSPNPLDKPGHEFWVRPISLRHVTDSEK